MSLQSLIAPDLANEGTVGIWYIRRRLGRTDYKDRRIVRLVSLLIAEKGFPPPLPCLKGKRLMEEVTTHSEWLRPAVDAWLVDFLPPDNAMSVDRAAMADAAREMDEAAGNLGLRVIAGGRP